MELEGGAAVLRIFADSVEEISLGLVSEARSSGGADKSKKSCMSRAISSLHTAFLCTGGRGDDKLLDVLGTVVEAVRSLPKSMHVTTPWDLLPEMLTYALSTAQENGRTCTSLGCLVLALRAARAACINTPSNAGQALAPLVRTCSDLCLRGNCSNEEACALMELLASAPPASLWDEVTEVATELLVKDSVEVKACVVRELPFLMLRCSTTLSRAENLLDIISQLIGKVTKSSFRLAESGCGAIADIVCILCCHKGVGLKGCQVRQGQKGTNEIWGLGLWGWGGQGEERRLATCPHCQPDENGMLSKESVGYLPTKMANKLLKTLSPLLSSRTAAEGGDEVQAAALRTLPSILAHVRPSELVGHSAILPQIISHITAPGAESAGSSAVRAAACVALGSMVSRGGGALSGLRGAGESFDSAFEWVIGEVGNPPFCLASLSHILASLNVLKNTE